jgi:hypothetical protein
VAYTGQGFSIPVGQSGLRTDDAQNRIPPTALILANNVVLRNGLVERDLGSRRWNTSALSSALVGHYDFWPDDITQRQIVVTRDGLVRKFSDPETSVVVTPTGGAPTSLSVSDPPVLVAGGGEAVGRPRKLFIMTGNSPIQVLSGDATTRANITTASSDWTTSYPTGGVLHAGRLCVFGNRNDPHRLYMSDPDDHEKFTGGTSLSFSIFPGEGEGLFSAYVFKGRLFMFKYPSGAYFLDDSDPDTTNWSIRKLSGSFGAASRHCAIEALNDAIVANSTGSLTSMSATNAFGDITSGDVLKALKCESYMRQNMSRTETRERFALYYEDQKQALFTYRSSSGVLNDSILVLDFKEQEPRVTWNTKDQPNFLSTMKDTLRIRRPVYGAEDGYLYVMDRQDRDVAGNAFTSTFQTPHMDFGFADPGVAEKMKLFDFLEVTFEETGNWDLSVDVFIDREFVETLSFRLTKGGYLGTTTSSGTFPLGPTGNAEAIGGAIQSQRRPLHGTGRRISLKCYNSGLRQNFKIAQLTVYFRVAAETQKT